ARVVAGAVVGSLAFDGGDRWSDLDLTFAVPDDVPLAQVLEDWTHQIVAEFDAVHLFDLPSGGYAILATAFRARTLWLRRPPCTPRAVLHRTGPVLASPILDRRPP